MSETTISKDTRLTPKQEKFVLSLIQGKTQREAYMEAYPGSKKWKPEIIDQQASRTLKIHKVFTRYQELMKKVEEEAIMSAAERRKWLSDIIKKGTIVTDGTELPVKSADRLKAIDILNKMSGEYITRIETTEEGLNVNISIGYEKDA